MSNLTAPVKWQESLPYLNAVLMQWKIKILGRKQAELYESNQQP